MHELPCTTWTRNSPIVQKFDVVDCDVCILSVCMLAISIPPFAPVRFYVKSESHYSGPQKTHITYLYTSPTLSTDSFRRLITTQLFSQYHYIRGITLHAIIISRLTCTTNIRANLNHENPSSLDRKGHKKAACKTDFWHF